MKENIKTVAIVFLGCALSFFLMHNYYWKFEVGKAGKERESSPASAPAPTPSDTAFSLKKCRHDDNKEIVRINGKTFYIVRFIGAASSFESPCMLRCFTSETGYTIMGSGDGQIAEELEFTFHKDGRVERDGFICVTSQDEVFDYIMKNS